MNLELTQKQYRRLLDMIYIGNWVLNSTRGDDRFADYDEVESLVFSYCEKNGMPSIAETVDGKTIPSRKFSEGGIHEAIMDYEDTVFFEILAEELARRDMEHMSIDQNDFDELTERINEYIDEFERNGMENITLDI